jgi:F-type H+-transporting ATPase subunit b
MKKLLPGLFSARSTSIQKSIEDARKASAQANTRLSEIESRLGRLDAEIASIRSSAEQQAKTEEERLRASTEEEKNKIVQAAEQEIAAAQSAAQRELKQFVAQLAVSLAEKKISVNDNTVRELVRSFTNDLGNDAKGGRA